MSRLSIFCSRSELSEWLAILCAEKTLQGILFTPTGVTPFCGAFSEEAYRAFFYPPQAAHEGITSLNDVHARRWGWLDVAPGGVRDSGDRRVVLLTEIVAEKRGDAAIDLSPCVRWLKRKIASELHSGVSGHNTSTGGTAEYSDIYFTLGALTEYERGTVWKQSLSDRVIFKPIVEGTK